MIQQGLYKHYKGGFYTVLFVATESTNERDGRRVVVYVSHQGYGVRTRDLTEWEHELTWPDDMQKHPRFMRWQEPVDDKRD